MAPTIAATHARRAGESAAPAILWVAVQIGAGTAAHGGLGILISLRASANTILAIRVFCTNRAALTAVVHVAAGTHAGAVAVGQAIAAIALTAAAMASGRTLVAALAAVFRIAAHVQAGAAAAIFAHGARTRGSADRVWGTFHPTTLLVTRHRAISATFTPAFDMAGRLGAGTRSQPVAG